MKKSVLIGMAILATTQGANAWSFGPIKGDDPKIVNDIVEGGKRVATSVSNGVRDVFAVVGNATGITDIIDHNAETFANIGRYSACYATLCYSEVLRQRELDKLYAEQKAQYEKFVAEETAKQADRLKEDQVQFLQKSLEFNSARYKVLQESYDLFATELNLLFNLQSAIESELSYRAKLQEKGITNRGLTNRELVPAAQQFAKNLNGDFSNAVSTLDTEMRKVSQATGRSMSRLSAEVTRILEADSLKILNLKAVEKVQLLRSKIILIDGELKEIQAQQESNYVKIKEFGK